MRCLAAVLGIIAFGVTSGFVGGLRAQTCTPLRPSLVSTWDSHAVSGTKVSDLKSRYSGSMVGGVTVVSDPRLPGPRKFESAFRFDGSGFINMGTPAAFQFGTRPFSLEAWFFIGNSGKSGRYSLTHSIFFSSRF